MAWVVAAILPAAHRQPAAASPADDPAPARAPTDARPTLHIELGDVRDLAEEQSPAWAGLEARRSERSFAERRRARPENPALGYEAEILDPGAGADQEHTVSLAQRLRLPHQRARVRRYRDERLELHERELERDRRELLAELRADFIAIRLATEELERLSALRDHLESIEEAVAARAAAGETDIVEDQLLRTGAYTLESRIEARRIERAERAERWRAALGIDEGRDLALAGRFSQIRVGEETLAELEDDLTASPRLRASQQRLESARRGVQLQESMRWPDIGLEAGYLHGRPGPRHGFVVGVSIPLPVFDTGRQALGEARALQRRARHEVERSRREQDQQAERAIAVIRRYRTRLAEFPGLQTDDEDIVEALAGRYREGETSLGDVLSSVSVLADGYATHFDQLETYFDAVTALEALAGRTLVKAPSDSQRPQSR